MSTEPESTGSISRSGGADLNAQGDLSIGEDVVGRDKFVIVSGDLLQDNATKIVKPANHNHQVVVIVALVALVAIVGLVALSVAQAPTTPASIVTTPATVAPALKSCVSTPVAVPTSMAGTGPLAIAPSLPDLCNEVKQLASYLAGNTVQIIQKSALENVDETDLEKVFRGDALEQMKEIGNITIRAIATTTPETTLFQVDPLAAKITNIAIVDAESMKVRICVIIKATAQRTSRPATPYFQFALVEMLYQKIGSEWFVTSFPYLYSPPKC